MTNTFSDTYPSAASIEGENARRLAELAAERGQCPHGHQLERAVINGSTQSWETHGCERGHQHGSCRSAIACDLQGNRRAGK